MPERGEFLLFIVIENLYHCHSGDEVLIGLIKMGSTMGAASCWLLVIGVHDQSHGQCKIFYLHSPHFGAGKLPKILITTY